MKVGANLYLVARSETELLELCNEAKDNGFVKPFYCAIDLRNRADLDQLCHDLKGLPIVELSLFVMQENLFIERLPMQLNDFMTSIVR